MSHQPHKAFTATFDESELELLQNAMAIYIIHLQSIKIPEDKTPFVESLAKIAGVDPKTLDLNYAETVEEVVRDLTNSAYLGSLVLRDRLVRIAGYDMAEG